MDAIYTFNNYSQDSRPRLQFPTRTGRQTTYAQWLDYQFQLNHDESPPPPEPDRPLAPTIVNHGRWLWLCPACLTAVQVSETDGAVDLCCCPACFNQGFVQPAFPADRAAIEAELYRQPGYRWNAPFRNWEPGWSLAYLRQRTAAAQVQLAAGVQLVRAASIGTPRTWSVGEVLTAANMNTYIREIQRDLIGTNGPIEFRNALVAASMTTAERDALPAMAGMILHNSTLGFNQEYDGSEWGAQLRYEKSQLTAIGNNSPVRTATHSLGAPPVMFQSFYERVKDTELYGFNLGDQIVTSPWAVRRDSPDFQVYEITSSQYKFRFQEGRNVGNTEFNHRTLLDSGITRGIRVDNNANSSLTNGGWGVGIIAIG